MITNLIDDHARNALIASVTGKTSWGGAGGAFFGYITSQEGLTFLGFAVALLSAAVNIYFRWREYEFNKLENDRAHVEHQLRLRDLRDECEVSDGK